MKAFLALIFAAIGGGLFAAFVTRLDTLGGTLLFALGIGLLVESLVLFFLADR